MSECPLPQQLTEIVSMMADGKSAKQIAGEKAWSPWTAQTYIATAKKLAGVSKDTALVAKAIRGGWIE
jgi:DNA-binding NarL/FixJ family response regulator